MESRQESVDRIRKYCSMYKDCTVCPQYKKEGDTFICEVIERIVDRR